MSMIQDPSGQSIAVGFADGIVRVLKMLGKCESASGNSRCNDITLCIHSQLISCSVLHCNPFEFNVTQVSNANYYCTIQNGT
jgi:hypothetical protein